jgi:hypothetical protein
MTYNRGRQAVITNELSKFLFKNSKSWCWLSFSSFIVDIITGASAL